MGGGGPGERGTDRSVVATSLRVSPMASASCSGGGSVSRLKLVATASLAVNGSAGGASAISGSGAGAGESASSTTSAAGGGSTRSACGGGPSAPDKRASISGTAPCHSTVSAGSTVSRCVVRDAACWALTVGGASA